MILNCWAPRKHDRICTSSASQVDILRNVRGCKQFTFYVRSGIESASIIPTPWYACVRIYMEGSACQRMLGLSGSIRPVTEQTSGRQHAVRWLQRRQLHAPPPQSSHAAAATPCAVHAPHGGHTWLSWWCCAQRQHSPVDTPENVVLPPIPPAPCPLLASSCDIVCTLYVCT